MNNRRGMRCRRHCRDRDARLHLMGINAECLDDSLVFSHKLETIVGITDHDSTRPNGPGHDSPGRRKPQAPAALGKRPEHIRAVGAGQPLSRPYRAWAE